MLPATVLMLTDPDDRTAERVAAELAGRGVPLARIDAADFPENVCLAAQCDSSSSEWTGTVAGTTGDGRAVSVELSALVSVYYRRPTQFRLADGMSGPERAFAYGEARRGFGGVLQGLDCLWMNDPVRTAAAEYKPLQLVVAARCGLRIPASTVTNDPGHALAWAERLGRPVAYKPLGGVWHPEAGEVRILYTSRVEEPAHLDDPALGHTAHLFQERIDKAHEVRAIVVGQQVFAVAIHANSETGLIDWRADYDSHHYEVIDVPEPVRVGLLALHSRLGLVYGACDLVVTPGGDWVFLETNPSGEWGWLAAECGLPIATAIADLLQEGNAA